MAVSIVRLGTRRGSREGLRIGTVRRPPRGVPKTKWASEDYFDVWLPNLSPSAELMKTTDILHNRANWKNFERRFRAELARPDQSHLLDLLAALSHAADFSIGCYCAEESTCHRSILKSELEKRRARIA